MLEVVGLITARGGSKGLPRKNVLPLAGKPLIAWTIEAAQRSRHLRRVIVSTDDPEIAEISRQCGAEVPFLRPGDLAGDASPHVGVVLQALDWFGEHEGRAPEWVMLLQPTSPLRTAQDIDAAIELAESTGADAVVSVVEPRHHPYLMHRMDERGGLTAFMPSNLEYARRQDLPAVFATNGAIYLIRDSHLRTTGTLTPDGSHGLIMPEERSLDIDTAGDFHLAELILEAQTRGACGPVGERGGWGA